MKSQAVDNNENSRNASKIAFERTHRLNSIWSTLDFEYNTMQEKKLRDLSMAPVPVGISPSKLVSVAVDVSAKKMIVTGGGDNVEENEDYQNDAVVINTAEENETKIENNISKKVQGVSATNNEEEKMDDSETWQKPLIAIYRAYMTDLAQNKSNLRNNIGFVGGNKVDTIPTKRTGSLNITSLRGIDVVGDHNHNQEILSNVRQDQSIGDGSRTLVTYMSLKKSLVCTIS